MHESIFFDGLGLRLLADGALSLHHPDEVFDLLGSWQTTGLAHRLLDYDSLGVEIDMLTIKIYYPRESSKINSVGAALPQDENNQIGSWP